ncbi:MAG: DUF998 domain-containing protein [Anaerolineae bacterium]|jgi:hypothetical membrane protein|nr:DUF998 domain-containing protein [Anaerolineae bacterium]
MKSEFLDLYPLFGIMGSISIIVTTFVAALFYVGRKQERFSMLNHFISELGEQGVSQLAPLFNGGLIFGGFALVPFIVGLGLSLDSVWAKLGLIAGVGAALACAAVGVFPMNRLAPHAKAAFTFFRLGLVTIVLFSIAIFAQPAGNRIVPLAANIFGALATLSYAAFLGLVTQKTRSRESSEALNPEAITERPRVWHLVILEWAIYTTTQLWFLGVALTLPT